MNHVCQERASGLRVDCCAWFTVCLVAFSAPRSSAASAPIIDIDPVTRIGTGTLGTTQYEGFDEAHFDAMIGWTFHVEHAAWITQVGWFDHDSDGLSRAFEVGLWQDLSGADFSESSNPTQLLGTPDSGLTIPAGASATLNGVWRVVDLPTPLNLPPGDYELAGVDTAATPDVIEYVLGGPSNPDFTIGPYIWGGPTNGPGFHVVTNDNFPLENGMELGPMLFTNVPESSAFWLLGSSVVSYLSLKRKRPSCQSFGRTPLR